MIMKNKAIYFYQYLPPWRIDVFNEIGKYYELTIVFTNAESKGFTYNRNLLLSKLINIKTIFLNTGIKIGSRVIRTGIRKIIQNINPDIIFSHEYSPTSLFASLYKKEFNYKLVITTSDNLNMAINTRGIKFWIRKFILNHSDFLIVYSDAVRSYYSNEFPNLKIGICPNIQNPSSLLENKKYFPPIIANYRKNFGITNEDKIILYIGRLVKVKGLDLLIDAFSKVQYQNYKLVIVGKGDMENQLKEQARNYNISDKVIFAGFFSGAELYAWYEIANYFILPSRYEPFGAVVNESLVFGCPVVASKYIGATDFLNENNSIIFDPLNSTDFKTSLEQACNRFAAKNNHRVNLMPVSFEQYVSVFSSENIGL